VWDRYDRRTDPIKNRVKGFLGGVSERKDLLARSVASFLFRFAFAFLSPQMRLLSPASNCAWFFAGLSDSRVVHDKRATENFRYFSTFSCWNPVF